jgi:hypothetical protein
MQAMQQKMMQHMQQGGTSMAQCPRMHSMGAMGVGSADDSQQSEDQQQGSGSGSK